eukprot:8675626-Alexandrium_andersonii.AAC.1
MIAPVRLAWSAGLLTLADLQPDRAEEVERALDLARWSSRLVCPARMQPSPPALAGAGAGG